MGGIIVWNYGNISYVSFTGNITGTTGEIGGIVGINDGPINYCYSNGNFLATSSGMIGGIFGDSLDSKSVVNNCYSMGSVVGAGQGVAGFAGRSYGTIYNSYSNSNATSSTTDVGGFCGTNYGTIYYSYSKGAVSGPNPFYTYGFSPGSVVASYWDKETSGISDTGQYGRGTPKTTAEMKTVSTYTLASAWDFVNNPPNDVANLDHWNISTDYNEGYPFLTYFNADPTIILVNITYPENNGNYSNITELNYTITSSGTPDQCWYSNNGGNTNSSTSSAGTNFSNIVSETGTNQYIVYCNTSNNLGTNTVSYSVNAITIETLSPTGNINAAQNSTFDVTVNVTCLYDTCNSIDVSLDPSVNTVKNGGFETGDLTSWTIGGNANWTAQSTTVLEGTYAAKSGTILDNQNTWIYQTVTLAQAANLTFSWKVSSEGSWDYLGFCVNKNFGDAGCTRTTDDASTGPISGTVDWTTVTHQLSAGSNKLLWYYAKDGSGSSGSDAGWVDNVTIMVQSSDKIGLVPTIVGDIPFWTINNNPSSISLNKGESTTVTWTVNATGDINSSHIFYAYANITNSDINAFTGNWNVTISDSIPDTTYPNLTIDSPTNTSYSSTLINLNYTSEDETGIDSCWYSTNDGNTNTTIGSCSNTTIVFSTGDNNITVYTNDTSNNINQSNTILFNIDTTLPDVLIDYPTNNSYAVNISEFNYTAIDNIAIDSCWYSLNEGTTNTTIACGTNLTSLTSNEGDNTWYAWANDTAGNENSTNVSFFKDTIFPSLNIDLPANTSYNSLTVNLNYTVSDTNIDSCWYSLNDGNTNTSIANCLNITFIATEGDNNITVYANDTLDNLNMSNMIFFNVDTIQPDILIDYPTNTSYSINVPALNYSASDNIAIDSCWYSLNEGTTNITVACETNLTDLTSNEGDNTWYAWANDTAGNENSINISFLKDTTPPLLTINIPINESNYSSTIIELNYTATDNILLNSCWYNLNEINTTLNNCLNTTITAKEGQNNLTLYVNDTLDNLNQSDMITFNVDTTPPIILNASAENYFGLNETGFIFNITAMDETTEIDTINLSIQNPDELENTTITLSGNGSDYNGTWDTTSYNIGIYYIDVWANDSLDNTIERDNILPIIIVLPETTGNIEINQTVDIIADNTITINAQDSCDIQLSISENKDITNGSISIACFNQNIENGTAGFASKDLLKYFTVVVSDDIEKNLTEGTQIRLYYTDAEISAAEIDESTLRIYKFNDTTNEWDKLAGGVNTALNYVYADVTSFSSFGIGGSAASATGTTTTTTAAAGGGGGGGGGGKKEKNLEISQNQKLFDIIIQDFDALSKAGEFFKFKYFLKGMGNINDDVTINFWLEKDETKITSGKDTIYMGSFEEKIEESKLYIPLDITPGVYDFKIQVTYQDYTAESKRTIELKIDENGNIAITEVKQNQAIERIIIYALLLIIFVIGFKYLKEKFTNYNNKKRHIHYKKRK